MRTTWVQRVKDSGLRGKKIHLSVVSIIRGKVIHVMLLSGAIREFQRTWTETRAPVDIFPMTNVSLPTANNIVTAYAYGKSIYWFCRRFRSILPWEAYVQRARHSGILRIRCKNEFVIREPHEQSPNIFKTNVFRSKIVFYRKIFFRFWSARFEKSSTLVVSIRQLYRFNVRFVVFLQRNTWWFSASRAIKALL